MGLWLRYARVALMGQFSKRSNLVVVTFAQALLTLSGLAAVLVLFRRFGTLAGYSRDEVLLLFGVAQVSFSVVELLARGFDSFPAILAQGEFDRILARPRGTVLQVLGARLEFSRLGRALVGAAILAYALRALEPAIVADGSALATARYATIAVMTLGSGAIFAGIFVLGASLAFLSPDGLEVVNIFSDGGREMSQYPLSIYDKALRRFFTFVVPFGCVNWLPLEFALGRPGASWTVAFLPLAGLAFLALSFLAWRAGVRRHASTGS